MISIKTLALKNFLSIGNVSQSISFKAGELFLILGENLDLGGNDNKNGTGKTTIINGLSYALFGKPLVSIKLENLINKTNAKQMFAVVEFEKNGTTYRIERGRKPNIFKFYANNAELSSSDSDESQGEGRLTQVEIEKVLGMSHEMFKHLVALNTYTEPFLSMRAADQRVIIEQLLGITKLSEKADALRVKIKETKDIITQEQFRISAIKEANRRIEENIVSLQKRSTLWATQHEKTLKTLSEQIEVLSKVDIEAEIKCHETNAQIQENNNARSLLLKEISARKLSIQAIGSKLLELSKQTEAASKKSCPMCAQTIEGETHEHVEHKILSQVNKLNAELIKEHEEVESLQTGLLEYPAQELCKSVYSSIREAYSHKSSIENLIDNLAREKMACNPYIENIISLQNEGLQEVSFDAIHAAESLLEHQEFLLKLLTNKDSFVRKKIIRQNLTHLNRRLEWYLVKLGLPHKVEFLPDLSVEISEHGRDLDFDNLSRGERTRLILSLSWAFRDVFESLNERINLLYIDELVDNGLDSNGVESALSVLKKMSREDKRCVHLISHRDELVNRVDNVIRVVKEGGFTSIEFSEE